MHKIHTNEILILTFTTEEFIVGSRNFPAGTEVKPETTTRTENTSEHNKAFYFSVNDNHYILDKENSKRSNYWR